MYTRKQKKFLDQLKAMVAQNGHFPTVREICRATGLSSTATVHDYLHRLHEQGHLTRKGRLWDLVSKYNTIPLVGIVPAGNPLEIFESLGEEIELPEWMADKNGDSLGFRVQGESMKDAYIQEGDVVVVKRAQTADPGEMVVAYLEEDAAITLKRLRKNREGYYWLQPENPDFSPIHTPFQLVGKVVGVLRKYR